MTGVQQATVEDIGKVFSLMSEEDKNKFLFIGQGMAIAGGATYESTKPVRSGEGIGSISKAVG